MKRATWELGEVLFEFHDEEIEALQEKIAERFDFCMISHTHQIYGICGRCQREEIGADQLSGRHRVREV